MSSHHEPLWRPASTLGAQLVEPDFLEQHAIRGDQVGDESGSIGNACHDDQDCGEDERLHVALAFARTGSQG